VAGLLTRAVAWSGRELTRVRRRWPWLRRLVPLAIVRRLVATRSRLTEVRHRFIRVEHRTAFANVYHCAVQKTGSQWLMSVLSDVTVYRFSGLTYYHYQSRARVNGRPASSVDLARLRLPEGAIVSPLLVPHGVFRAMPKPDAWRAFFVLRDPRELVVSWYFSTLRTHLNDRDGNRPMTDLRQRLARMSQEEGLCHAVRVLADRGRFAALQDWARAATADPRILLLRFEELAGGQSLDAFRRLFEFCDVRIPEAELGALLSAYSFARLSGRPAGTDDTHSHLRSGAAATWPRYFTPRIESAYRDCAGMLHRELGY
jgi:hypothetical protein